MAIDLPFGFNRLFKGSAIVDQVFTTTAALNAYLTSPVRFAGMIVSLDEGGEVFNYTLNSAEDTWIEIGQGGGSSATGVISGGLLTTGAGVDEFTVSDGTGQVIDAHTDPLNPVVTEVTWTGLTNITVTVLAQQATTVAIDSTGTLIQRPIGGFTPADRRDFMILGNIVHIDGVNVSGVAHFQQRASGVEHSLQDLAGAIGVINNDGNVYGAAAADLTMQKTAGSTFTLGSNVDVTLKSDNLIEQALQTPVTFLGSYQDGVGGFITVPPTTLIDPAVWDDGTGVLNTVNANNWSVKRIFFFPNSGISAVVHGQGEYNTLSAAIEGLVTESFVADPAITSGVLRGFLIIKGNCSDLSDTGAAIFAQTDKFGHAPVGGIGSTTLERDEFYIRQLETFRNMSPVGWFTDSANVTTAEETVNPIDGSRSAMMTQSSAIATDSQISGSLFFTDEIMKEKRITTAFEFDVLVNSGDFRIDTIVFNGTVDRTVSSEYISETSKGTFKSEFEVGTLDEYTYFEIFTENPDDLNTFKSDNFRIDLSPREVKQIYAATEWESYTPISQGLGTPLFDIEWRRDGSDLLLTGSYDPNTPTGVELQIGLPVGLAVDGGITKRVVGNYFVDRSIGNHGGAIIATAGDSYFNVGNDAAFGSPVVNALTPINGDGGSSPEQVKFITARIPIEGWPKSSSGTVFANDVSSDDSYIRVTGMNGRGSTATYHHRFDVLADTNGTAVTYADSATLGGSATVNESGLYDIDWSSAFNTGGKMAIVKNYTTNNATQDIPVANLLALSRTNAANAFANLSCTVYLNRNDVIYFRGDQNSDPAADQADRAIVNVSKSSPKIENLIIENPEAENTFYASIDAATATVTSATLNFIQDADVVEFTTGTFDIDISSMGLTVPPTVIPASNSDLRVVATDIVTATTVRINMRLLSTQVFNNQPFSFSLRPQGADYKTPKGFVTGGFKRAQHITGGIEYNTHETWNGAPIYARSYERLASLGVGVQVTLGTIDFPLKIISIESVTKDANGQYITSGHLGAVVQIRYDDDDGRVLLFNNTAQSVTDARTTIKYLK